MPVRPQGERVVVLVVTPGTGTIWARACNPLGRDRNQGPID